MDKASLPPSYGWVFTVVILWTIVLFFAGAVTSPPGGGMAAFMWGFTIWYMHKKDIKALISFHKILMWLAFIATGLGAFWAILDPTSRPVSVEFSIACLMGGSIYFALHSYFSRIALAAEAVIPAEIDAPSPVPMEKPAVSKTSAPSPQTSPAATPVTRLTDDVLERLEKIASLRDRGILTEQEFAAEKSIILGINPSRGAT